MTKSNDTNGETQVTLLEDKIEQLIFIADDFLKLSEDIGKYYNCYRKSILMNSKIYDSNSFKALVIQQKLFMTEVLLILKTLFESPGVPSEISYEYLFHEISKNTNFYTKFEKIRIQYKTTQLSQFRNKLVAHKDCIISGDPFTHYTNIIPETVLQDSRAILDLLKELNSEFTAGSDDNYLYIYDSTIGFVEKTKSDITKLLELN